MSTQINTVMSTTTDIICGLGTVPAKRTELGEPEQYALPGSRSTTCHHTARRAALAIDSLIKTNGGEQALARRLPRQAA